MSDKYDTEKESIPGNFKKIISISKDSYKVDIKDRWIDDFADNFVTNWKTSPVISEDVYAKYHIKIEKREFNLLPPISFSDQFINTLEQMIDIQYHETFLPDALTIIYSFYIYDEKIELSPLQHIFVRMKSVLFDCSDEIKDQILKIFGASTCHSQESHNFIINLIPIDLLSELFNYNTDLSDSISVLANGYSKNENDIDQLMKLLELSINISYNSIQFKKDNELGVFDPYPFNLSLDTICTICLNLSENKFNLALDLLYKKEFDILLNSLLQDHLNFSHPILQLIYLMFKFFNNTIPKDAIDLIIDTEKAPIIIPRIEYTIFISFLIGQEKYDDIDNFILSEKILNIMLIKFLNVEPIFNYIYKSNLVVKYLNLIQSAPLRLRISTISSLNKMMNNLPHNIMQQIYDIQLPFVLIDEIESDSPELNVSILKCLSSLIHRSTQFGFPVQGIKQCFIDNVDLYNEEDPKVQEELANFNLASNNQSL